MHQEYQVPLEQINIVPGAVEIDRFALNLSTAEARTKLGWSQDRPIIFCVRRLAKRMGLENSIAAIDQVRKQYPDVLLYIAGKGALGKTLHQQIAELELTRNVSLLGYIADEQLPLAYRAANFSVVPTTAFEGFGLIIIESLAAGTPVIGTPIGGIPEILQPFCPDLLFESASVEDIAQGIIEILSGERKLPSREACQAYIQEKLYLVENCSTNKICLPQSYKLNTYLKILLHIDLRVSVSPLRVRRCFGVATTGRTVSPCQSSVANLN